jgi:hypothetical protein
MKKYLNCLKEERDNNTLVAHLEKIVEKKNNTKNQKCWKAQEVEC